MRRGEKLGWRNNTTQTDLEHIRLFKEAVQKHGKNWDQVAAYVRENESQQQVQDKQLGYIQGDVEGGIMSEAPLMNLDLTKHFEQV